MSIPGLYVPYGVRIHTSDITPAQTIGGIVQYGVSDDVQVEREAVDGNIFPSITSMTQHGESIEFTSLNVDKMLDVIGTVGLCARGTNEQTGVELFLAAKQQCTPGPNTGNVNLRLAATSTTPAASVFGMLTPQTLAANHAQHATMSARFMPQARNGAAGITVANNIGLPAIADNRSRFALSENFDLNGVSILGKKGVTINFNPQMLTEGADGNLAPEWVSIENLFSIITVTGITPDWALAANIPRGGKAFAHSNCSFFLRKRNPNAGSGFHANNEEEHIKITAAGKAFITNLASGQATRPTETALVMYVEFDGTNAPIVANTNQEIT